MNYDDFKRYFLSSERDSLVLINYTSRYNQLPVMLAMSLTG